MHLYYLLGFQVYFESQVFNKIRSLNSKCAFLSARRKRWWIKWKFSSYFFLIIFDSVVAKNEISIWIEKDFTNSGLLSNSSRIWKPQRFELTHPISSLFSHLFRHLTSHISFLNLFLIWRFYHNLSFSSFYFLFDFRYLFLNIFDFSLSISHSFLNHLINPFKVR